MMGYLEQVDGDVNIGEKGPFKVLAIAVVLMAQKMSFW